MGASSWLNAMPLKRYHFDRTKSELRDGIAVRYLWNPVKMPSLNCRKIAKTAEIVVKKAGQSCQRIMTKKSNYRNKSFDSKHSR